MYRIGSILTQSDMVSKIIKPSEETERYPWNWNKKTKKKGIIEIWWSDRQKTDIKAEERA